MLKKYILPEEKLEGQNSEYTKSLWKKIKIIHNSTIQKWLVTIQTCIYSYSLTLVCIYIIETILYAILPPAFHSSLHHEPFLTLLESCLKVSTITNDSAINNPLFSAADWLSILNSFLKKLQKQGDQQIYRNNIKIERTFWGQRRGLNPNVMEKKQLRAKKCKEHRVGKKVGKYLFSPLTTVRPKKSIHLMLGSHIQWHLSLAGAVNKRDRGLVRE